MPNYDEKTGIHFGVISPNNICQETLNDLCDKSTDTIYEESKNEMIKDLNAFCDNHGLSIHNIPADEIIEEWNQSYQNDNHGYEYEDQEYTLKICDDNFGIFVIKSPYYTYTRLCSPCAPNAGDLDNPIKADHRCKDITNTGAKTYCLPREFFDSEYSKIPYRYYRVDNDKEEIAPIIEVK